MLGTQQVLATLHQIEAFQLLGFRRLGTSKDLDLQAPGVYNQFSSVPSNKFLLAVYDGRTLH